MNVTKEAQLSQLNQSYRAVTDKMCGIWAIFGSDDDVSHQCASCLQIAHRGPDQFRMENINHFKNCCLGFHRLAIMDDVNGMQPMRLIEIPHLILLYNGEIYNYKTVQEELKFKYTTSCDGEAIIRLYDYGGIEFASQNLDGVFSFCLLDVKEKKVYLGRDTYGVRPSFKFLTEDGFLGICSEAKGLLGLSHDKEDHEIDISPVLPGWVEVYNLSTETGKVSIERKFPFTEIGKRPRFKMYVEPSAEKSIHENLRALLTEAVRKRMMAERRLGSFLSGGLDSSLITGLVVQMARKMNLKYPIQTFSIGMEGSPDVAAARKVAAFLGTEHHEVSFTAEEGIEAVREVIRHTETYDTTTIRASVGMYLVSKYVQKNTDSVVIFSGEGADELAQGYIYFHKAPDAEAAAEESLRLLKDLYLYDVLRADRTTAACGLEMRVPFLDTNFTSYYLSINAHERQPQKGVEKYLLRKAFDEQNVIPQEILWRPKEAFSDGMSSHKRSWYEILQDHVETFITNQQLEDSPKTFPFNPPRTKEAFYFRQVFEEFYPGRAKTWVPYYWMPKWVGDATDPSARTLKHYKS